MALRRRPFAIVAVLVLAAAAAAAAVVWWTGDEPQAVDASRALDQDRQADREPAGDDVAADQGPAWPPSAPDALTGRWYVDVSRPFDGAAGLGTFAGYRVEEELATIGASTAIGRTPAVAGTVELDGTRVVDAEVRADLSVLVSDDARRDGRVRTMLGPRTQATFTLDRAFDLGEVPHPGEVIELVAHGTLAIGDVSQPVEVAIEAAITDMGLLVAGSTDIALADFDVEVPSAAIVLRASEVATIEWQLFLRRD